MQPRAILIGLLTRRLDALERLRAAVGDVRDELTECSTECLIDA